MNYCDKIHYSLLTASPEDFPSMIDSLLSRLPEEERILRLVLLCSATRTGCSFSHGST